MSYLTFYGTVSCCDCGSYGGADDILKIYQDGSIFRSVTLCDKCARKRLELINKGGNHDTDEM